MSKSCYSRIFRLSASISMCLWFAGCASTHSNIPLGDGQYLASFTDKQVGADGTSVVEKIMKIAETQCGAGQVIVVNLNNSGFQIGTFPRATLTYKCKDQKQAVP